LEGGGGDGLFVNYVRCYESYTDERDASILL
jgi:hypothetical protein